MRIVQYVDHLTSITQDDHQKVRLKELGVKMKLKMQ